MSRVKEFNENLLHPIKHIDDQKEWMDIIKLRNGSLQPNQVDKAFCSVNACIFWLDAAGALGVYLLLLVGSIFSSDSDAQSHFFWEVGFSYVMACALHVVVTGPDKEHVKYAAVVYLVYGAFNALLVMTYMVLVIPLIFYVPKALFSLLCAKLALDMSSAGPGLGLMH